jgi:hypothetical protein
MLIKMDRRKFINASALTGAGLVVGPYLKGENSGNDRPEIINSVQVQPGKTIQFLQNRSAGS